MALATGATLADVDASGASGVDDDADAEWATCSAFFFGPTMAPTAASKRKTLPRAPTPIAPGTIHALLGFDGKASISRLARSARKTPIGPANPHVTTELHATIKAMSAFLFLVETGGGGA
jgi:hypothetical protein